jgi:hypothetical protein
MMLEEPDLIDADTLGELDFAAQGTAGAGVFGRAIAIARGNKSRRRLGANCDGPLWR